MSTIAQTATTISEGLIAKLVCPREKSSLTLSNEFLICQHNHRYRVVDGIPILLVSDVPQTHFEGDRALQAALSGDVAGLDEGLKGPENIDAFVHYVIGATNGGLYQHLVGNLEEYPIPELRLPAGKGKSFLEIGSNWGRWCIAAARAGYKPLGIDPSLRSVRAARRVAKQLGAEAEYVVADGRFLPFPDEAFDCVFSYSVLQHLAKENVRIVLREIRRVLGSGGTCMTQMANMFGVRCLYHQACRKFREPDGFGVRYWTLPELQTTFSEEIGKAEVSVDGFFSLNAQLSDAHLMPPAYRSIVYASEGLRRLSLAFPPLAYVADSLYIRASRPILS